MFHPGQPVAVRSASYGEFTGTIVGYWRNNAWQVREDELGTVAAFDAGEIQPKCDAYEGEECPAPAVATLTWRDGDYVAPEGSPYLSDELVEMPVCEGHWKSQLVDLCATRCKPVVAFL